MPRTQEEVETLRERVAAISSWYHRIDLGDGVVTPGPFDMDEFLPHYHFPERLDGMRVLDVGASTGYFSCELERRGAAEIVALDLPSWAAHDWTPRYRASYEAKAAEERDYIDRQVMRAGFDLVVEARGCSRIRKVEMSIYDVDPEELGTFDIVLNSFMLMHVRDPILGIQRMRSVLGPDGLLVIASTVALDDLGEPVARFVGQWNQCNWWHMSSACLGEVLRCCDLETEEPVARFEVHDVDRRFRDPSVVFHARPRSGEETKPT